MAETETTDSPKKLPDDSEKTHVRMSFGQHLEELRKRFFYAAIGAIAASAVCMYFTGHIITFLIRPYELALVTGGYSAVWLQTGPAELVIQYLAIGFKAGLILAAPWIIYQLWLFIGAGLYKKERRLVYKYIGPAILLFFIGVAFFYFIVLPLTLRFFVEFSHATWLPLPPTTVVAQPASTGSATQIAATQPLAIPILGVDPVPPTERDEKLYIWFNKSENRVKMLRGDTGQVQVPIMMPSDSQFMQFPKLDEYLGFVLFMALIFGISFELPMIMLILCKIGIVKVQTFRKGRRIAYFIIAIAAAVMAASPDIMSMISLMLPLAALYEIGIVVSALLVKQTPDEPEEPETTT